MRIINRINWILKRKYLSKIKLVVLDVDGVLTDGGLWYNASGELLKRFDVKDGLGIRLLQHNDIEIALLSGGLGGATEIRANQLNIKHCLVGIKNKAKAIESLINKLNYNKNHIAFVGDDINDICLKDQVSLLIATNDASLILKRRSDAVLVKNGGHGAIRELAERILKAKGVWQYISKNGWKEINI